MWSANSTGLPVVGGTTITTTMFNAFTADVATGLTTAWCKDGQSTPTANIKLGGYKLTGLGAPSTSNDALSFGNIATISTLTLSNSLSIANGGTGATTAASAINALLPTQTSNAGKVLTTDGSVCSWTATGSPGTVTSVAFSGGSTGLTVTGSPITAAGTITLTGTLGVANGGTGLTAGTSGGIPYYSSSSAITSSAALTANAIVLGGGVGAAPAALGSLGTTTTVLHGNAAGAPTYGAVSLTADVSGTLPAGSGGTGITSLASGIATWLGTSSSANLAAALTDETGSGSAVFATSPTLVTPILGTPTSGSLTNCTNIPVANATGTLAIAHGGTAGTDAPGARVALAGGSGALAWMASGTAANTGRITVSSSSASGTPADGEIWLQYTP